MRLQLKSRRGVRSGQRLNIWRTIATLTVGAAALVALRCSSVPGNQRIGIDAPSGAEQEFGPVADFLDHRCGSLDCHGQAGRNLRIWGCEGMRLASTDVPQCSRQLGGKATTPNEHQATYRSLVGLEPGPMSAVVEGNGADPDLLTFVRKARGEETHKGGALITPGDPQDQCITSWLAGQTDVMACATAIGFPMFPIADASTE
jgi:hypothetical protein